jgi:hypothetical protein
MSGGKMSCRLEVVRRALGSLGRRIVKVDYGSCDVSIIPPCSQGLRRFADWVKKIWYSLTVPII